MTDAVEGSSLLVAVVRLAISQTRATAIAARAARLTPTAWAILSELALDGWLTNGQLAARLGMSTGGVTPALDRLEQQGYLSRQRHPADGRSNLVSITEVGQDLLGASTAALADGLQEMIDDLTPEEREVILRFLIQVNEAYDAEEPR